jgi:hypothetical protein
VSLVTLWNNFFAMASAATREDGEVGAAVEKDAGEEVQYNAQGKKKGKHDKPKPWDTPDIDHWKLERFDPSWNEGGMLEESSFSTLFPQYREKYLRETWPVVTRALKEHGISCELNLVSSVLSLSFNDRMSVGLHVFHMQNSRSFQAHCAHSIIVRMDSVGLHYHWWWTDRWRVQ